MQRDEAKGGPRTQVPRLPQDRSWQIERMSGRVGDRVKVARLDPGLRDFLHGREAGARKRR